MPNRIKKTNKREEELKELGVYPENPDETMDSLEEEVGLEMSLPVDEIDSGETEEEE